MPRPWRSGFCGVGNPPESHRRCAGAYDDQPCSCFCHMAPDPSPAADAGAAEAARDVQAQSTGQPEAMRRDVPAGEAAPRLGVYADLDEATYHADPTSVSASGMKQILRSPAHFRHALTHPQSSEAMDLGSVAHTMVLGTGCEYVAVEGNRNRNDVKAAIAEAEAAGKVVLKPEQLAAAERMADAVLTHPIASRLLTSPGRSELSMFWLDQAYDVIRRCRWDRLSDDGIGIDLKTCNSAAPDALPKRIVDLSYDLAAFWYLDVAAGLRVDVEAYAWVFVESAEPHPVVVVEPSWDFLERGAALAQRALDTYRRCLDTNTWPAYADDDFLTLGPPRWADTADQITEGTPV